MSAGHLETKEYRQTILSESVKRHWKVTEFPGLSDLHRRQKVQKRQDRSQITQERFCKENFSSQRESSYFEIYKKKPESVVFFDTVFTTDIKKVYFLYGMFCALL